MHCHIPLFPEPFELLNDGEELGPIQLKVLEQIESNLTESIIQDVIEQMHKFYVDGQNHIRETLPQMILLGAITQKQFDDLQKDCPRMDSSIDFINYLLPPYSLSIPDSDNWNIGSFGLSCECKWDENYGVGVWFENWKPVRVGFAEAGYP